MKRKLLVLSFLLLLKAATLQAQAESSEDTAVLLTIIFIERQTIDTSFPSSVGLYGGKGFMVTDFLADTFHVGYRYPFCIFRKKDFRRLTDSVLVSPTTRYYWLMKLGLDDNASLKIPYALLHKENILAINRKRKQHKTVDCYYTIMPGPGFFTHTVVCTGEIMK